MLFLTKLAGLLVELAFTALDGILAVAKLIVALIAFLLMLALELEEFLLCLQYLLLLDILSLKFGFFYYG